MEKGNQAASPVVGQSNAISAKMKSNSSSDSPGSGNCNASSTVIQSVENTNSNLSPFTAYNPDSKPEDVILPKNGTSNCGLYTGHSPSPYFANDNSPLSVPSSSPSAIASINARFHSNVPPNRNFNYGSTGSPNEGIPSGTGARNALRSDKNTSINDQGHHTILPRSLSVNNTCTKAGSNNVNTNIARRMSTVDAVNHTKESTTSSCRTIINSTKLTEKGSMRRSPRNVGDFARTDARNVSDNNNSAYSSLCTARFNDVSNSNPSKGNPAVGTNPNLRINHQVIGTSSSSNTANSIHCNTVVNEGQNCNTILNNNPPNAPNITTSNSSVFQNECNISTNTTMNDLNIENSLLSGLEDDIESLQNDGITLNEFPFAEENAQDDIGSNALNLSAEEVQQALNSVSADSSLPDISLNNSSTGSVLPNSNVNARLQSDILNDADIAFDAVVNSNPDSIELKNILSSSTSTVNIPITTSSTTAVSTSITSATSNSLNVDSICPSFSNDNLLNSTASISLPISATCTSPSVNSCSSKSHLQEILGTTDTNRLLSMARPVDASHTIRSSTSLTSCLSNSVQQTTHFNNQMSASNGRNLPPVPIVSSGISPRHKLASTNSSYHRMLQRTSSNPHPLPSSSLHSFEMSHTNPNIDHSSKIIDPSLPKQTLPYDQSKVMTGPPLDSPCVLPYTMASQGISNNSVSWQRQVSSGGLMQSPGISGSSYEGNKSPRGSFYGNFQPKTVNPMSGLQSTVDAIPNLSNLKNNNSMGPPHTSHRVSTPNEYCSSVPMSTMLPPQSPLTTDKRSASADGSVLTSTNLKSKSNKRERGQSLDSKDGDKKEVGPKSKRRKSKSKDETKKIDSRASSRLNSSADAQYFVFNTDLVNSAANAVLNHSDVNITSIINHHNRYQGNTRLLPSKSMTFLPNPLKVEHPSQKCRGSSVKSNIKSNLNPIPGSNNSVKSEVSLTPNFQVKTESNPTNPPTFTSETDVTTYSNNMASNVSLSPSVKKENSEEVLTDEQRKHREESLHKIQKLKSQFPKLFSDPKQPSNAVGTRHNSSVSTNKTSDYTMSRYLQTVQESNKDNSPDIKWFRLVQAYNEQKRRTRYSETVEDPPPYSSGAPSSSQRWINSGHPMGEPGSPHKLPNSRYPHHVSPGSVRLAHEANRFPVTFQPGRFPRFIQTGSNSRVSMFSGPNFPNGMMARPGISRLPQSHPLNEAYPFSEKLKEQASYYRTDGMHSHAGNLGFDSGNPEIPGPRMGSPEWIPYANSNNQLNRNISHLTPEGVSPTLGPNMIANQPLEPGSVDPSIGTNPPMHMNNPTMVPSFSVNSFPKGSGTLPSYPNSSLPNLNKPFPPQPIIADSVSGLSHETVHSTGMMGEAMARRGEPRPPDLNINPSLARTSPTLHGGRHHMHSPGMPVNPALMSSSYVTADAHAQNVLPQMSPHPSNIPRSPMVNSPNIMKSPMGAQLGNQMSYVGMGQGAGALQQPLEQNVIMQGGPRSAGAVSGTPSDWNSLSQQALMPIRVQSASAMMPNRAIQKPPLQQIIEGVSRFQLPGTLYQNEVKEASSPPPLSHMMENPALSQDPPPLSHNPSGMDAAGIPVNPGSNTMIMRHPRHCIPTAFDAGPRPIGPRMIGPSMGDGYGSDFNRPPSHPGMCVSPCSSVPQGVIQPGLMAMHGPNGGFISQSNLIPPVDSSTIGGGSLPVHHGINQNSTVQNMSQGFDLSGFFPSDKPTETLSYFPSGGNNPSDSAPPLEATSHIGMPMRNPSMTQQSIHRYTNMPMNHRPLTPGSSSFHGSNPGIRMPGHGTFGGPNPPGYPGPGAEGYMSPSWDGVPRPQMMSGGVQHMPVSYQPNRSLM